MISIGYTFWMTNPNSNNPPHLYFVITSPINNNSRVLLVNMTERRIGSDGSCILVCGDHLSVTKDSVINYAEAIFPETINLENALNSGILKKAPPADLNLVQRILQGALVSKHLATKFRPIVQNELSQSCFSSARNSPTATPSSP